VAAAALHPRQHLAGTAARTHQRIEGPGNVSRIYSRACGLLAWVGGVRLMPLCASMRVCGRGERRRDSSPSVALHGGWRAHRHHITCNCMCGTRLHSRAWRCERMTMRRNTHGGGGGGGGGGGAHLPMLFTILLKLVTQVSE
jgi:hypothetical protein